MATIKSGTARLNAKSLVIFTRRLINKMSGNANFPDPQPALADLTAKLTEFEALAAVAIDGSKADIYNRNASARELKVMLRTLSNYVALTADGDGTVILSSGFDVRSEPEPVPPLTIPESLKAMRSSQSGKVNLDWAVVTNALNYQVEFTMTDPNLPEAEWVTAGVTSKSRFSMENLTPGDYYWFRVKAFGRDEVSGYSDPATVMAA